MPESVSERVRLLEDLSAWRLNERTLAEANELGRACFGGLWRCADSDWTALANAAGWIRANSDIRHVAARFEKPDELLARKCRANERMETIVAAIEQLFCDLQLACIRLFGSTEIREVETSQLGSRLERWAASREDLSKVDRICGARQASAKARFG